MALAGAAERRTKLDYQELRERIRGVQAIVATPFTDDFRVDEAGLRRNVGLLCDQGIQILTPLGTGSEFYALSVDERKQVIRTVAEQCRGGGAILAPGASAVSLSETQELCRFAAAMGSHAVMVAPPFYMAATRDEVLAHYRAVAGCADIGIIIYYWPELHRARMDYELLDELVGLPNVVGIKWCELSLFTFTLMIGRIGRRLPFISGYGEYLASYSYLMGSNSISSAIANFAPRFSLELRCAAESRDWERVREMSLRAFRFYELILKVGSGVALVKAAMRMVGLASGPVRPPASVSLSPGDLAALAKLLRDLGVEVRAAAG